MNPWSMIAPPGKAGRAAGVFFCREAAKAKTVTTRDRPPLPQGKPSVAAALDATPRAATLPTVPASWEQLILVDARDRATGRAEKLRVHQLGLRHRAFSVFLVDARGRLLLQRRSAVKHHSAGLWANACCGHPRPGERTVAAARRRVREELGLDVPVTAGFRTSYRTTLPNGLIENEIVHVLFGVCPAQLAPDPKEVGATAFLTLDPLRRDIARRPRRYAYWLRHYLREHHAAVRRGAAAARREAQAEPDTAAT
ncbi:MAG: isopentenyl-diphosphate Delta-isomerase [Opitutaceae bacterium]